MRSLTRHSLAAIGMALMLAACGDETTTPTPVEPTPTPTQQSKTFAGELTKGGQQVHSFDVGAGVVQATLYSLSPDSTKVIGSAYGFWDGTNCTAITPNAVSSEAMTLGTTLVGTATANASLCLRVYDPGSLAEDTTYSYTMVVSYY